MANNCATDYVIECREKKQIEELYGKFQKLLDTQRPYERDGKTYLGHSDWLGYIVTDLLGKKVEDIPCRGTFQLVEEVQETPRGFCFKVFTDTAWCACDVLFNTLAEKFDLDIYYLEIEPGCEVFYTNDDCGYFFPERYYLDSDAEGEELFNTFDELAKRVEEITGTLPSSMDDISTIQEEYSGEFLSIHVIEVI